MPNLEKKNDIEIYSEKKNYSQPQLKEIGNVNYTTKGGTFSPSFDSNWSAENPSPMS